MFELTNDGLIGQLEYEIGLKSAENIKVLDSCSGNDNTLHILVVDQSGTLHLLNYEQKSVQVLEGVTHA